MDNKYLTPTTVDDVVYVAPSLKPSIRTPIGSLPVAARHSDRSAFLSLGAT